MPRLPGKQMVKKKLIPFKYLPASWGLCGSTFAEAEINYLYEGQERDIRLATLRYGEGTLECQKRLIEIAYHYGDINDFEYRRQLVSINCSGSDLYNALIDLDCEFGKISKYEAAVQKLDKRIETGTDNTALTLALGRLDIDLSFERITRNEYEKRGATLREEPWISVVNASFNPKEGIDGVYFEFDWNPQWIEFLRLNGYVGYSDEQIVDDWFSDVCRSHVQTEMAVTR